MKTRFRYFCFICASLLATQVFAADMSGWSDKTVCRLVKAGDVQEHIDEATKRGLGCGQTVATNSPEPLIGNPLDSILVSANTTLIENKAIFDQEKQVIKDAFSQRNGFYWEGASVEYCFDNAMMNLEASMKIEVAKSQGVGSYDAYHRPISICNAAMVEQLSRLGATPDYLADIMLTWASDDVFKMPSKNLSVREYQIRMYGTASYLGVYGGYYALNAKEFNYTDEERKVVEDYFAKQLTKVDMSNSAPRGLKSCNFDSPARLGKGLNSGKMSHDTCGSPMLKATTGALALGLRLGDQDLFNAGIKNLKLLLSVFDDEGIFVPYAAGRGAEALGYTSEIPLHMGAWTELLAIAGYDFLEHESPNGMRVKDLVAAQINVLNDPDMLLKYTAKNGAYGGFGGPTVADFNKLTLMEKWARSNINIKQIVRQNARYVDRFRPDLVKFRDQNYVANDQYGNAIKTTDDHMAIDSYMLYVANNGISIYDKNLIEKLRLEKQQADDLIKFEKMKAKKSDKSISLKWQKEHAKKGLEAWLESIKWEGSLADALSLDGSLGDDVMADGVYALHYGWISSYSGKVQKRSMDKLTVLNGIITHEAKPSFRDPVISQRATMEFEVNKGVITAIGTLQYNPDQRLEKTTFRGVVGTGILIGTITDRDIVMLHLTKW